MKIYLIGLGKMGKATALNMRAHHHDVHAYDVSVKNDKELEESGVFLYESLESLFSLKESEKKIVWLLIPSHYVTQTIEDLKPFLNHGDIFIDAGNSKYSDSIIHANTIHQYGALFLDIGTSGGTYGALHGANLMIGGDMDAYTYVLPIIKDIALPNGYLYVGQSGAGHFVKMVHNGIEYAMMQAIAEGLDFMHHSPYDIDYKKVLDLWNHGSIIESKLVGYTKDAFARHGNLSHLAPRIDDSGEGKWMIEDALKFNVSIPLITQSLFTRFKSRDEDHFLERIIAGMRESFGGHKVYKK